MALDSLPRSDDADFHPGDVEVRMLAEGAHLPILKAVASTVALREDFDLDAVEDVKLAVEELCSALLTRAQPEATLTCCFGAFAEGIRVHGDITPARSVPVDHHSFGWHVLTVLTDSIMEWAALGDGGSPDRQEFHLEIVKQRTPHHDGRRS